MNSFHIIAAKDTSGQVNFIDLTINDAYEIPTTLNSLSETKRVDPDGHVSTTWFDLYSTSQNCIITNMQCIDQSDSFYVEII